MRTLTFPRLTGWRIVATVLILAGIIAAAARFWYGLGATTHLTDEFPWGIWIGFDFLGIGLAAAGFTLVATVHLFHAKQYEPIVRPALLTAFVGYLLVVAVLIIDLGRPDHFWHPLVMWNVHSVMCEISWCLMLYTTVLSLEFAPIVLAKLGFEAPCKWIHAVSLPLMILGVLLSTLHQSSFGSLYLIVPTRLHPLWYSPLLPILFYISCIGSGISMVLIETLVLSRSRGEILAPELRGTLAKIVALALAVYLVVRFQDLLGRGMLPELLKPSYYSLAFYTEIILGFAAPFCMLLSERVRLSRRGLYTACLLVLGGFAANRMDTAITGLESWPNHTYFPSLIETLIMLGIAATGFAVFNIVTRLLPIVESRPEGQEELGLARPYSV